MYCPQCGRENADTNQCCVHCNAHLHIQNNTDNINSNTNYTNPNDSTQYNPNYQQTTNPYQPPNYQQRNNNQQYQHEQQQDNHQYQNAQQQNNNSNQPPNYRPYNSSTNVGKVVLIIVGVILGIGLLSILAGMFFGMAFSFWPYY